MECWYLLVTVFIEHRDPLLLNVAIWSKLDWFKFAEEHEVHLHVPASLQPATSWAKRCLEEQLWPGIPQFSFTTDVKVLFHDKVFRTI